MDMCWRRKINKKKPDRAIANFRPTDDPIILSDAIALLIDRANVVSKGIRFLTFNRYAYGLNQPIPKTPVIVLFSEVESYLYRKFN